MEEREIAIKIEGLRKRYRLGTIGGGTLKGDIESWWARKRGKEDPNSKIGAKSYKKNEIFYALDGIDLTIYKGERLGIIGHNGAGKSTLLKLLSRVTAPTEGRICIDGRIASMLEVGTGFNGELTGRENIYLNGAILGMTKAEVDAKMEQIIDFSEVRQFIDTPVKRYSSGMYVKLAFSVAAHLDSEIMIMDEVLAVGDLAFQKKCLNKMSSVSKTEGRTILYVSHNMDTIRQLCDRVILLEKGKIVFIGKVEEGIQKYAGALKVVKGKLDLNDYTRNSDTLHKGFRFTEFSLLDRQEGIFFTGEKLSFIMNALCSEKIESLRISVVIISADNISVTKADSDFALSFFENEKVSLDITMDSSFLAPGKYTMIISAYTFQTGGAYLFYDVIDENTICFDVLPTSKFNNGVEWNHKWWGRVFSKPLLVDKKVIG